MEIFDIVFHSFSFAISFGSIAAAVHHISDFIGVLDLFISGFMSLY